MRGLIRSCLYVIAACAIVSVWLVTPVTERVVDCTVEMTHFDHGKPAGWVTCEGVYMTHQVELPEAVEVGARVKCVRIARYVPGTSIKLPFTSSKTEACKQ